MYVLLPMPCLFFGDGSTRFLTSREGGGLVYFDLIVSTLFSEFLNYKKLAFLSS